MALVADCTAHTYGEGNRQGKRQVRENKNKQANFVLKPMRLLVRNWHDKTFLLMNI